MTTLTRIELQSLRRVWRAIPSEVVTALLNLRSRVSLDENSALIGISERGGRSSINPVRRGLIFEALDDAEVFAAGMLFEREGSGRT